MSLQARGRPFQSGHDPRRNTNGREPGSKNWATQFKQAVADYETEDGKNLFQHIVERARESDRVLTSLFPYILPRKLAELHPADLTVHIDLPSLSPEEYWPQVLKRAALADHWRKQIDAPDVVESDNRKQMPESKLQSHRILLADSMSPHKPLASHCTQPAVRSSRCRVGTFPFLSLFNPYFTVYNEVRCRVATSGRRSEDSPPWNAARPFTGRRAGRRSISPPH